MKKILSVILAIAVVAIALKIPSFAENHETHLRTEENAFHEEASRGSGNETKESAKEKTILLKDSDILPSNLDSVRAYVESGNIGKIGLYDVTALKHLCLADPEFNRLCSEEATIASVAYMRCIASTESNRIWLDRWLEFLSPDCSYQVSVVGLETNSATATESSYQTKTLVISDERTITIHQYIGSETPQDCPYASSHLSAVQIGAASYHYNCHAYSWCYKASIQGLSNADLYFLNSPEVFYNNSPVCYAPVNSYTKKQPADIDATKIKVGDILVYYFSADGMQGIGVQHSATVVQTATNFSDIVVRSKWRDYGVYEHKVLDCPYYVAPTSTPILQYSGDLISVYRTNSNHRTTYKTTPRWHKNACKYCPDIDRNPTVHSYTQAGRTYYCYCGYVTANPILQQIALPVKKETK